MRPFFDGASMFFTGADLSTSCWERLMWLTSAWSSEWVPRQMLEVRWWPGDCGQGSLDACLGKYQPHRTILGAGASEKQKKKNGDLGNFLIVWAPFAGLEMNFQSSVLFTAIIHVSPQFPCTAVVIVLKSHGELGCCFKMLDCYEGYFWITTVGRSFLWVGSRVVFLIG